MLNFYNEAALTTKKVAETHYNEFQGVNKTLGKYIGGIKNLSILDIGCGHLAIQTLLRHSFGQHLVGIDFIPPNRIKKSLKRLFLLTNPYYGWIYKRIFAHNDDVHDLSYFNYLNDLCSFPLSCKGLDIRYMDATCLDFPDKSFDAVISFSTFEHILDVQKSIIEIKRVLKDEGIAIVGIHLFPSLSGGHYPEWSDVSIFVPENIPPWDHLRNPPAYTIKSEILNTLRESDFMEMFKKEFEILETMDAYEHGCRHLLTEDIRKELADYSEDELFKRVIVLVVKK